ncbi:MAG: UDP-glucose/GDP-mannose dehydrogenase family protein [Candidatus Desulforudis sp.]|nr:UDP-glucose/GDP-mannose dehydrogenase family protein [Bacillota bacterium]MBV1728418.1 UDP-glucose/GDP-mannose dehydrogenase family protein [Desulforudis sp.]MBV1734188.1 UDP-glucose/GDP-mannose dehydrogenase family protein [Desulforudis sp.]MBV1769859.1 UDP-glucose/GDP-mannose dehydrogenase family protein [Desulforudis sp.]
MKVSIIGTGYVGLTTAVALAYIGHEVHCIDQNPQVIESLSDGRVPIHEPGIKELLAMHLPLSFGGWDSFDPQSDVVFIAVCTPCKPNGDADLTYVEAVAAEIGRRMDEKPYLTVVVKSTVPLGSARRVESIITAALRERQINTRLDVASNPEFLREGSALYDTFYPDRIVVGANKTFSANVLRELYTPILEQTFAHPAGVREPQTNKLPVFITTTATSAELIKYAANAFLAMKISFINEFAGLAEHVGADITEVARGIGLDERIGMRYLMAGAGWGGSCFGKDVSAILHAAQQYNYDMYLVDAAVKANLRQHESIVKKLQTLLKVIRGTTIGILGISFKPNTDDTRDAPFLAVAKRLVDLGATVKAHDPVAIPTLKQKHPDLNVICCDTPEQVAADCDALVLLTEWDTFRHLDYNALGQLMRQKFIVDGRNALNPEALHKAGFTYVGVGR